MSSQRHASLILCACVLILSGCPHSIAPGPPNGGPSLRTDSSQRGGEHSETIDHSFGVRWPETGDRSIQAMPAETQSVTFHISSDDVPVQVFTLIRAPGSETASRSVPLYPGDYTVRVRAYATDSPNDASPVVASGARSFSVVEGQAPQRVVITLAIHPNPEPASPLPSVEPSSTPTPSPSPSPAATPTPTPSPAPLSWALVSPGISFSDCYFVDFKTGWVVGSTGGRVRKTTDGGITWISQDIPGAGELFSVFFLNSTIGWVGSRATIFKTSDGGSTWTALPRLDQGSAYGDSRGVTGLFFTDESNGLYTAAEQFNGGLYSTSNGGQTWYRVAQGALLGGFLSLTGVAGGGAFTTQGNVFNDRITVRYKNGGVTDVFQKTLEFISNSADEPSLLMATRPQLDEVLISSDGGMSWSATPYQIVPVQVV
ncbi:Ycf48-like protein [compost metagenome]